MSINWFTFFAQIVNFLILLALLRRFLYGPILQVMADREAQIAARFKEAEETAQQARAEAEAIRADRAELDAQREALLQDARSEAEARRMAMIDDARAEVDELQKSWIEAVEREKERFLEEVRARMGEAVYRLAQDVLADLANAELEAAIVEAFLDKLSAHEKTETGGNGRDGAGEGVIIVRSAFELAPNVEDEIRRTLTDKVGASGSRTDDSDGASSSAANAAGASIAFALEPELICGIEAQFGSRRVAWSIRDYLDSYAEQLDASLVADMSARTLPIETEVEDTAAGGILPG